MPRHTSSIRPVVRPQDARHDRNLQKSRRQQRLAAKAARKTTIVQTAR